MITAEQFKAATGYEPQDDDLERCNCSKAGELTHSMCGWDYKRNMPNFIPSPPMQKSKAEIIANLLWLKFRKLGLIKR